MAFKQIYQQLPSALYQEIPSQALNGAQTRIFNHKLAKSFNLPRQLNESNPEFLIGNKQFKGACSLALGYSGHQFGNFVPLLGDGRAHLLGQVTSKQGIDFDLQLKGSGKTRFSRGGDGRCTFRAALREYILGEYLHILNIPTTRSLYVVSSDEMIMRDGLQQAGVVCRVAKSHLRIGTFQLAAQHQDPEVLKSLANIAIEQLYPAANSGQNPYLALFEQVQNKLVKLVISWMAHGFIHGVMNTDNILLSGETIDFGPCAFLVNYNPQQTFSSIDRHGRYAFGNQINIMLWNLTRFAECLIPLVAKKPDDAIKLLERSLSKFIPNCQQAYYQFMCRKLALDAKESNSANIINELLATMETHKLNYRTCFANITKYAQGEGNVDLAGLETWFNKWQTAYRQDKLSEMQLTNPLLHLSNQTIESILTNCADDPDNTVNLITRHFTELAQKNSQILIPDDLEFCSMYKTFCGT